MTQNEAEKHLNFNPLPSDETQKKIDYFITPYNSVKVVTKFMDFNKKEVQGPVNLSSHDKWKKVSINLRLFLLLTFLKLLVLDIRDDLKPG